MKLIELAVRRPVAVLSVVLMVVIMGWLALNTEYSKKWPNITRKGEAPADADSFKGVPDKFDRFFTDKPGQR